MNRFSRVVLIVLMQGGASAACRGRSVVPVDAAPAPSAAVTTPTPITVEAGARALPPLDAPWIEEVDLPDRGVAFVAPPTGATSPRPIIVAVHGAVDDPGLMCSAWRLIADVFPFVVCPAGRPLGAPGEGRKYVWSSGEHVRQRVDQAVETLRRRYPRHVAEDAPMVYAAFSQGANMAGELLVREASRFPRVVFTEGGYHAFDDPSRATGFARGGGQRVLFTCSHRGCVGSFAAEKVALEHAGAAVRIEYSGPHGHSIPPPVREKIHATLPWVVEGLPAWDGYATAPMLPAH